jgi:chromosome segregation ATPase
MTVEERLNRIEHITAGLAEERRKDCEECRQLWRDTQRQLNELSVRVIQLGDEMREADKRLGQRIEQLAEESRAADKRLGDRIDLLAGRVDSLVSAIGSLIAAGKKP